MAFRASETFFVGSADKRRRMFVKDAIVPDDVAKGRASLVYDDGAPKRARKTAPEASAD